jgi:signal transduction histidine kinase
VTLRRRLSLTLLLAAAPLVAGVLWLRGALLQRGAEDALRESILARMEAGGRERCEEDPAAFSGRRRRRGREGGEDGSGPPREAGDGAPRGRRFRPFPLHAYEATLQPADPEIPPLPDSVRRALQAGDGVASVRTGQGLLVAVRMPWPEGPCAVVAAFRPEPARSDANRGLLASALVLCAGFLVAVWLASGPVVRRIRGLAADVRQSAASRYAVPVRVAGNDEVAQLARAFNDAGTEVRAHVAEVEEREAALRSFVANTTHDVMIPLTVLQGHLAHLRRPAALADGPAGSDHERRLAAAAEEAHYIGSLLQNLSAAAKLEAGPGLKERHPVDLSALVERVVERHRTTASAAGVSLAHAVPEAPLWCEGDVTLLEQAVGNVVHNAIRHNRPGGHVAVVLDEVGAGRFRLRVADDGAGVPAAQLPRLGERRFRTEEARQRHPEGLGLGLSIARDVAERHAFTLAFAANEPSGLVVELAGVRAAESAGSIIAG